MGLSTLISGTVHLNSGTVQLISRTVHLNSGTVQLISGTVQLINGTVRLINGTGSGTTYFRFRLKGYTRGGRLYTAMCRKGSVATLRCADRHWFQAEVHSRTRFVSETDKPNSVNEPPHKQVMIPGMNGGQSHLLRWTVPLISWTVPLIKVDSPTYKMGSPTY